MLESGQICYSLTPDAAEIKKLRQHLNLALRVTHLTLAEQQVCLLSVTEWTINLIKHATIPPDEILVELVFQPNDFNISIKDNGSPFKDFNILINKEQGQQYTQRLPEGGIGLYLIRRAFPNLEYTMKTRSTDLYNVLTLNARVKPAALSQKPLIAIIEDNLSVCQLIALFLKDHYAVETFYNGMDFLEKLPNLNVDLVISDISMPKMDGLELRKRLAISPETHLIPFVFLTSSTDLAIEKRANELGIDDFIHKPVNKQQLHSIISRVLKRRQGVKADMGNLFEKKVTATLRPELPTLINDYRCAMTSRHAAAGGGDFIVYLQHHENNYIILGDVMGHGLQAKFFAHVYAGYIQGLLHSLSDAKDISSMLNRFSFLISHDIYLESVIVTCLGLSLEPNGHVTIVNAGHPNPLLINNKKVEEIDINGTLPGLEEKTHYDTKNIILHRDRLLIFTDGLIEVGKNAKEKDINKHNLLNHIAATSDLSLEEAHLSLRQYYDDIVGSIPIDDATFIFFEYSGS